MMGKRAVISAAAAAAAIAAAAVLYMLHRSQGQEAEDAGRKETPVCLNNVLTDRMSDAPGLEKMDRKVERYMQYWHIRGAQLAVMRHDSLLFCKGYGIADEIQCPHEGTELRDTVAETFTVEMTPGHIMRVASVSKLITATGIMKLCEEGLLQLSDTVFGPHGILRNTLYSNAIRYTADYSKITVEHLLRHQAGFRRDPVFSANDVRRQMRLDSAPDLDDYSRLVLSKRLRYEPGGSQTYSNYGYMLLGRIIETVSGMGYEEYIQSHILRPAGCLDMHIAGNYYEDRRPNETRYFVHEGDGKQIPEYNGSGRMVERCYGGNDIRLLGGAGAWVCSAAELARFVASIDAVPQPVPDVIGSESVGLMTEFTDSSKYSLGWNDTDPRKGWVRTGTLAGTNAMIKYFPDGECWIWLANTSTWKGPGHAKYTSILFDSLREKFSEKLPARNLFETAESSSGNYPD